MIFFVRYHGKEHTVKVESRNQQLYVSFDHEPERPIDLQFFGNDCSFIQDNQVLFANIVRDKGQYTVWRPSGPVQFSLESEYKRIVNLLRGQMVDNENNVYAKMPGKIAKISVKEGDSVQAGSSLLVMEAMKMENEIRATMVGKIAKLCVKEGQAVETGALLIELDQS